MNLRTIFKAQAVILLINGLGSLFLTSVFIQQAGWTPTADLITIGQFLGVVFIVNGICSCLIYTSPSPRDISGSRMPSSA